ncbi:hypothetical protein GCM10023148_50400 [Actinokineospora soli]
MNHHRDERPRPLRTTAAQISTWVGLIGSAVTALVGFGVVNAVQADAVTALLGAIPGLVTMVTAVFAAFGVATRGERLVTPVSDPRDDTGAPLVPEHAGTSPFAGAEDDDPQAHMAAEGVA